MSSLATGIFNQATGHGGMQSRIFLCLSQARINWEGFHS